MEKSGAIMQSCCVVFTLLYLELAWRNVGNTNFIRKLVLLRIPPCASWTLALWITDDPATFVSVLPGGSSQLPLGSHCSMGTSLTSGTEVSSFRVYPYPAGRVVPPSMAAHIFHERLWCAIGAEVLTLYV